jgi:murein L,D-transpeptidase YafK
MKRLFLIPFAACLLAHLTFTPPATGQAKPEAQAPTFRPTSAQQNYPRVRAARDRRNDDIKALFAKAGLDYPPARTLLRVFKLDDTIELWAAPRHAKKFVHLKDYSVCMRSGSPGPKRRRGDMQVPEGFYEITRFNPTSQFLLSMKVGYPNRSDRIRGYRPNPGGDIYIHGSCVTIGCLPITDRWIEELYLICLDSHWRFGKRTLVQIFPTRLNQAGKARLKKEFAGRPELLAFWDEITPGYTLFEKDKTPARFRIDAHGCYIFGQAK